MATYTPAELAAKLKDGLLSFPVTAFDANLEIDEAAYRSHLDWQSSFGVAGLFAAGGTGEGFTLTPEEASRVVRMAVEEAGSRVPVLGFGRRLHQAGHPERPGFAEAAGAEGILLLPPYLTECDQEGLFQHVSAVCASTSTGVIVYNRANAIYSADTVARLADTHENFIGFKDAIGDIEHLTKVYAKNGDRLFYLGGLPTAETFALPLLQLGMSTYSSRHVQLRSGVRPGLLQGRAQPGPRSRHREAQRASSCRTWTSATASSGYGVSIVKGGLKAIGRDAGSVRPPLQNLTEADLADLGALIQKAGLMPAPATV